MAFNGRIIFLPEVKKTAYILVFIFGAFLATPTVVTLIDKSADVSIAFSVNEEENSKTQINLEFQLEDTPSNYESIHFLQEQKNPGDFYLEATHVVILDVLSPPPERA